MKETITHKELCEIALKWLYRPNSRNGHGCAIALSECRTGFYKGEIPDAIGFRVIEPCYGSVLVECKVSRADFLANKNKPYQDSLGVGNFRYFMAPKGLISVDELPPKWGLLEVNARGHISAKAGLASYINNDGALKRNESKFKFESINEVGEKFLLVRTLANTDPQRSLEYVRAINRERSRLEIRVEELSSRVNELVERELDRKRLERERLEQD